MVFFKKWPFFQLLGGEYRPEKCVIQYSRTEKRLSTPLKQQVKKVEKLRFFQMGQPMVLVQK